jgi:hypothetical protein
MMKYLHFEDDGSMGANDDKTENKNSQLMEPSRLCVGSANTPKS